MGDNRLSDQILSAFSAPPRETFWCGPRRKSGCQRRSLTAPQSSFAEQKATLCTSRQRLNLQSASRTRFYVGQTEDLARRLVEHIELGSTIWRVPARRYEPLRLPALNHRPPSVKRPASYLSRIFTAFATRNSPLNAPRYFPPRILTHSHAEAWRSRRGTFLWRG